MIRRLKRGRKKNDTWYKHMLEALIDEDGAYPAVRGEIENVSSRMLNKFDIGKVNFAMGWMHYFSNQYSIVLPKDMPDYERNNTSKGMYLILNCEDITTSKEQFEHYCCLFVDYMEKLKNSDKYYREGKASPELEKARAEYEDTYPLYEVTRLKT